MKPRKFYTDEDIELARTALNALPDLSETRKSRSDFLEAIKQDVVALIRTKGYTAEDVRQVLMDAGYPFSERALREMVKAAENPPVRKRRRRVPAEPLAAEGQSVGTP